MDKIEELKQCLSWTLEYIDSIPSDLASTFPAMPGFDRGYVDSVLSSSFKNDGNWATKELKNGKYAVCHNNKNILLTNNYGNDKEIAILASKSPKMQKTLNDIFKEVNITQSALSRDEALCIISWIKDQCQQVC